MLLLLPGPVCLYELLIVCLCTHHMHVTLQQQALAGSVKHMLSDIHLLLHAGQVMLNMPGKRWVSYCACMIKGCLKALFVALRAHCHVQLSVQMA